MNAKIRKLLEKQEAKNREVQDLRNELTKVLKPALKQVKAVYDNGGKSIDRYTVYYKKEDKRFTTYACLALSSNPTHPQGFGQHSEGTLGRHNGKRIAFFDLPLDCQFAVIRDLEGV